MIFFSLSIFFIVTYYNKCRKKANGRRVITRNNNQVNNEHNRNIRNIRYENNNYNANNNRN